MGGIDAVAREEINDHGARIAHPRLAEQLGCAEGQQAAHARGQCPQRASFGGQFRRGIRVGRSTHDDPAPVVEFRQRGVVAAGRTLREDADTDDADPGQSRGHRRG